MPVLWQWAETVHCIQDGHIVSVSLKDLFIKIGKCDRHCTMQICCYCTQYMEACIL